MTAGARGPASPYTQSGCYRICSSGVFLQVYSLFYQPLWQPMLGARPENGCDLGESRLLIIYQPESSFARCSLHHRALITVDLREASLEVGWCAGGGSGGRVARWRAVVGGWYIWGGLNRAFAILQPPLCPFLLLIVPSPSASVAPLTPFSLDQGHGPSGRIGSKGFLSFGGLTRLPSFQHVPISL